MFGDLNWLIEQVVEGLFTLFFAALGSYVMWKVVGPKVVDSVISKKLGHALMNWFFTPIKTGKKKKTIDEETGEKTEVDEEASPLEIIVGSAGAILFAKMMGKMGGDARKREAIQGDIIAGLSNPASPFAGILNSVNPRILERAIKDGDYIPIILDQTWPLISRWIDKRLNTTNVDNKPGAGWG